jgi:hypothetical protein
MIKIVVVVVAVVIAVCQPFKVFVVRSQSITKLIYIIFILKNWYFNNLSLIFFFESRFFKFFINFRSNYEQYTGTVFS